MNQPIYPRRALWDLLFSKQDEPKPLPVTPHTANQLQLPFAPRSVHLERPNRDGDVHRVPDPDFYEPPDDYDRS